MKNVLTLLCIGLMGFGLNAQKVIEKNLDYKGEYIEMNVKFASEIEVKTWDKSTVYFKADITTKDGKFLEAYQLDIDERGNSIVITSEAEPVFKKFQEEWNRNHPKKKKRYYNTNEWYEFNYVLYVPKNANFKVSSINGDLSAELIEGDFEADLINGDIDIKRYQGDLDLNTINGEIDVKLKNTSVVAETIHGDIYADENLQLKTTDRHVGQLVKGNFDNAKNSLKLKTINGNMYLRK
ncbi:DUF4097 family beta strand repeat-containing protein [Spongiimicrobium salis]|uniref:hypothetical protein n=1 Tax=Spongiimicrobium salis TaxID=1667022 RepID=UPI00374D8F2B